MRWEETILYIIGSDRTSRVQLMHWAASTGRTGRPFLNGTDFVEELPQIPSGVVLLDIESGSIEGFDFIERVARARPDFPIIGLLRAADMNSAVSCLRRGAADVVVRVHCTDALEEAVAHAERVLEDRRPMVEQFHRDDAAINRLSLRELEVLKCLGRGMTSKSIAEQMALSARTVEFYRGSMIEKLDCKTSAAAVAVVVRHDTFRNVQANLGGLTSVQLSHHA